jgi:hypothetical protein
MVLAAAAAVGEEEKASNPDVPIVVFTTLWSFTVSEALESSVSWDTAGGVNPLVGKTCDASGVSSLITGSGRDVGRGGAGLLEGESKR